VERIARLEADMVAADLLSAARLLTSDQFF